MSFYRALLATVAAVVIASPAFAEDTITQPSETSTTTTTTTTTKAEPSKLNLNTASAKELMKIKGVNAAKARAIVAYRKKHAFTSTDELVKVKGFKKVKSETLKGIEEQVTVD